MPINLLGESLFTAAMMFNQANNFTQSVQKVAFDGNTKSPITAQRPSFSRIWSDPVPNDSSPQIESRPASIRFPKNFHPVCK